MITFEEAKTLHEALQYDSMYTPRARLETTLADLSPTLDRAIALLPTTEIILFPWEHAMPFQRQWESVPAIKSARDPELGSEPRLWGHFITYRGIDCFASSLVGCVVVSGVRDLRKSYGPEDRIVLIEVQG